MNIKEKITAEMLPYKVSNIVIDRDSAWKGRASTMISFTMTGDDGPVEFEMWIANDLKRTEDEKVFLVTDTARKHYHIQEEVLEDA